MRAVQTRPAASGMRLRAPRIGLWDRYGGSMPRDGKRGALPSPGQSFTPLPAGVPLALAARVGIVA